MKTIRTNYLFFGLLSFFLVACSGENGQEANLDAQSRNSPRSVLLDTVNRYQVNSITGDTIKPVQNSQGDTIRTGVKVAIQGREVPLSEITPPEIRKMIPPTTVSMNPNMRTVPDEVPVTLLKTDSLKTFRLGIDTTSFRLLSPTGEVIPTGVPVHAEGKTVDAVQKKPLRIPLPVYKERARYDVRCLGPAQGLSSSSVSAVTEDNQGNIWLSTTIGGVSKYDGETLTHFSQKEGLSASNIWSSLCDSRGNLWFGTNGGGVTKYDGDHFIHFTTENGFSHHTVNAICEDQHGFLWFGTNGGGISRFEPAEHGDEGTFVHFTQREGLSSNTVLSIIEDREGNIWVGTQGGGVSRFNLSPDHKHGYSSITHITMASGLPDNNIVSIAEDTKGDIWLGTYGRGVVRFDGEKFVGITAAEGLSGDFIRSIFTDSKGNLWFGTERGGVSCYSGRTITRFSTEEGLGDNYIKAIFEDKQGTLWFGTEGGGVSIYNDRGFVHFAEQEGISSFVLAISEDRTGGLYFSTYGAGASRYNETSLTTIAAEEGLTNFVVSSFEDSRGNFWLGTQGKGLLKPEGGHFIQYTEEQGLCGDFVFSIAEDKVGNLWLATNKGISKMDPEANNGLGGFTNYTEDEGLSRGYGKAILVDAQNNVWFGTDGGGLLRYDGHSWTHFTEREGLINNNVRRLYEDRQGRIWFAGRKGGVSFFDGNHFTHFTENDGLVGDIVVGILEDKDGRIWIGTNRGLHLLSFSNDRFAINSFGVGDGLKDPMVTSLHLDSRNRLWIGVGNKLSMLDLNRYNTTAPPPATKLQHIEINGEFRDFRNVAENERKGITFSEVPQFNNYPNNLKLAYKHNHLTFHFAAAQWAAPQKVSYSYLLEGLENEWSQPTKEGKVDYRNLSAGTYTFKVKAIDASQRWGDPASFTFTIFPPWWQTWWAYTLYVAILVGIIILLIHWRTSALKRRQIELEREVEVATQEIASEMEKSERLLLNILPKETAAELKQYGSTKARNYDVVSVLFTDFKGFTMISEQLSPQELVREIDYCYKAFDDIVGKYGIEKIKTIGDAYMAAGGIPVANVTNPMDTVKAALEIRDFMLNYKAERERNGMKGFEIRIGIHTGPVVAGVVGNKKFAYDIWGDAVNIAARMESSGAVGMVNISGATYEQVKEQTQCTYRGKIPAKNKGEIDMYFVDRIITE